MRLGDRQMAGSAHPHTPHGSTASPNSDPRDGDAPGRQKWASHKRAEYHPIAGSVIQG
jgi:hypothetical protein